MDGEDLSPVLSAVCHCLLPGKLLAPCYEFESVHSQRYKLPNANSIGVTRFLRVAYGEREQKAMTVLQPADLLAMKSLPFRGR